MTVQLHGDVLRDALEHADALESLTIVPSIVDPAGVHDKGVLQWLHPKSFSTLVALDFSITFNMHGQAEAPLSTWIRDPYRALASDGLLPKLTALRSLKVTVGVNTRKDVVFGFIQSFGDQWGVLDRALVSSDGKLELKNLRVVMIRFALYGDEYHARMVAHLKRSVLRRVFMCQFPRLSALRAKQEITFMRFLSFSERVGRELAAYEESERNTSVAST